MLKIIIVHDTNRSQYVYQILDDNNVLAQYDKDKMETDFSCLEKYKNETAVIEHYIKDDSKTMNVVINEVTDINGLKGLHCIPV